MGFVVSAGQVAGVSRSPSPGYQPRLVHLNEHLYLSYEQIYRTQPQLRTVVGFIARNLAQVGVSVSQRGAGGAFSAAPDHPLAKMLRRPFPASGSRWTNYRLVDDLFNSKLVYGNAYWLKIKAGPGQPLNGVLPIPPRFVAPIGDNWYQPDAYNIRGNMKAFEVTADAVVHFHNWNPMDARHGLSPIETLRMILAEEYSASEYRSQMWRSGARTSGVISRPVDAPEWGGPDRDQFLASWASAWSGESRKAGGTPILEDGMTWSASAMTPRDAQYIESRQLTLQEVMAAYWLPQGNVTSTTADTALTSLEDIRSQLFGDALAPWAADVEQDIEQQLLPDVDMAGWTSGDVIPVFDFAAKMRGNFSQQTTEDVSAGGAPWMTRDEIRARRGLPPLADGAGAQVITPLNVIQGGLANPRDTAPNNPDNAASNGQPDLPQTTTMAPDGKPKSRPVAVKAKVSYKPSPDRSIIGDAMKGYYAKAGAAVVAKVGAEAKMRKSVSVPAKGISASTVFDRKRFDPHLAKDLAAASSKVAVASGRGLLEAAGKDPAGYPEDITDNWMSAMADGMAGSINDALQGDIEDALDEEDPLGSVQGLFDSLPDRADAFAISQTTAMASFGAEDAADKNDMPLMKTWQTGDNPRPEHSAQDGEQVARGDTFSDGSRWPGDSAQDPALRDGCNCSISYDSGE